jgi:hypothetical protein
MIPVPEAPGPKPATRAGCFRALAIVAGFGLAVAALCVGSRRLSTGPRPVPNANASTTGLESQSLPSPSRLDERLGFVRGSDANERVFGFRIGWARDRIFEKAWYQATAEAWWAMDWAPDAPRFAEALCVYAEAERARRAGTPEEPLGRAMSENALEAAVAADPGCAPAWEWLLANAHAKLARGIWGERGASTGPLGNWPDGVVEPAFELRELLEASARARPGAAESGESSLQREQAAARQLLEREAPLLKAAEEEARRAAGETRRRDLERHLDNVASDASEVRVLSLENLPASNHASLRGAARRLRQARLAISLDPPPVERAPDPRVVALRTACDAAGRALAAAQARVVRGRWPK